MLFVFSLEGGMILIELIFFEWVETTKQRCCEDILKEFHHEILYRLVSGPARMCKSKALLLRGTAKKTRIDGQANQIRHFRLSRRYLIYQKGFIMSCVQIYGLIYNFLGLNCLSMCVCRFNSQNIFVYNLCEEVCIVGKLPIYELLRGLTASSSCGGSRSRSSNSQ